MSALIESILAIENQATRLVDEARTEAEVLRRKAVEDAKAEAQRIDADTVARIEAYRKQAQNQYETDLAAQEAQFRDASAAVTALNDTVLRTYADRVVARYREV